MDFLGAVKDAVSSVQANAESLTAQVGDKTGEAWGGAQDLFYYDYSDVRRRFASPSNLAEGTFLDPYGEYFDMAATIVASMYSAGAASFIDNEAMMERYLEGDFRGGLDVATSGAKDWGRSEAVEAGGEGAGTLVDTVESGNLEDLPTALLAVAVALGLGALMNAASNLLDQIEWGLPAEAARVLAMATIAAQAVGGLSTRAGRQAFKSSVELQGQEYRTRWTAQIQAWRDEQIAGLRRRRDDEVTRLQRMGEGAVAGMTAAKVEQTKRSANEAEQSIRDSSTRAGKRIEQTREIFAAMIAKMVADAEAAITRTSDKLTTQADEAVDQLVDNTDALVHDITTQLEPQDVFHETGDGVGPLDPLPLSDSPASLTSDLAVGQDGPTGAGPPLQPTVGPVVEIIHAVTDIMRAVFSIFTGRSQEA
ncbi:MAG: hypothetical protein KAT00_04920 [Planctomycetes bacterium]|nr:hypothetical protein [Planctomycetota bacterium]